MDYLVKRPFGALYVGPMAVPIRLNEIRFNGGTSVDTRQADVVVLVGPNNSGKSRTLVEILTIASQHGDQPWDRSSLAALDGITFDRTLDVAGAGDWLLANRVTQVDPASQRQTVRAVGSGDFLLTRLERYWKSEENFGELVAQLVRMIGPGDARGLIGSPGRLEPRQIPDHAVQTLVRDPAARAAFESAFRAAFRQNLILDSWGPNTRIRLSPDERQEDFSFTSPDGLPSEELSDRLNALQLLEQQSDGIRAFAGLLLTLISVRYPVLMIDEPEAFLHPPQARLLGAYMGRLRRDGQLVVATHSLDILLGLLEQSSARVLVVRLSRSDERTTALTVDPEAVRKLWRDPLLRFSRALDGLFHEGVVIGEGDTDSQFYSAVSYHLASEAGAADPPKEDAPADGEALPDLLANPFDLMFAYAGGKQRIHMIASALSAVKVPVRCIVDFDVLNDRNTLERLVNSLGHDYSSELERLRLIVDGGIRGSAKAPTVGVVRRAVSTLDGADDAAEVTPALRKAIAEALEPPAGWAAAKRKGRAEVPSGDATSALQTLLSDLKAMGVFVVPSGAVESWVKAVPNKSTQWVADVIEGDLIKSATEAKAFVREVVESFE